MSRLHMNRTCHIRVRHVTYTLHRLGWKEMTVNSDTPYACVLSYTTKSIHTWMNVSYHVWTSNVTCACVTAHVNESCHIQNWMEWKEGEQWLALMSRPGSKTGIQRARVRARARGRRRRRERGRERERVQERSATMTHSYLTWLNHLWDDPVMVWNDSFIRDTTHSFVIWPSYIWQDEFACAMTQLSCDMTRSYEPWRIHTCHERHHTNWHDSFRCDIAHSYVTWLIHMCHDFSHVLFRDRRHVTWLIHCVAWLICTWHDSFTRAMAHTMQSVGAVAHISIAPLLKFSCHWVVNIYTCHIWMSHGIYE